MQQSVNKLVALLTIQHAEVFEVIKEKITHEIKMRTYHLPLLTKFEAVTTMSDHVNDRINNPADQASLQFPQLLKKKLENAEFKLSQLRQRRQKTYNKILRLQLQKATSDLHDSTPPGKILEPDSLALCNSDRL